jgi:zinc transport system permease protein
MDDFIFRAMIAGFGVAAVTGPLGSFIVWRRMSFFGDTLAHSALLGVTLGLLLGANLIVGIAAVCILVAVAIVLLQQHNRLGGDAILGILSHGTLALGLVVVSFLDNVRFDLMAILFGDILSVTNDEIFWIIAVSAVSFLILVLIWRQLLSITIHEDLARAEGLPVIRVNLLFMVLVALVVAAAMKVVGVLLVAAMLIIPASAARYFARTPEQMAFMAAIAGAVAVVGGLAGSLAFDTPAGPSIVVVALIVFVVSQAVPDVSRQP